MMILQGQRWCTGFVGTEVDDEVNPRTTYLVTVTARVVVIDSLESFESIVPSLERGERRSALVYRAWKALVALKDSWEFFLTCLEVAKSPLPFPSTNCS